MPGVGAPAPQRTKEARNCKGKNEKEGAEVRAPKVRSCRKAERPDAKAISRCHAYEFRVSTKIRSHGTDCCVPKAARAFLPSVAEPTSRKGVPQRVRGGPFVKRLRDDRRPTGPLSTAMRGNRFSFAGRFLSSEENRTIADNAGQGEGFRDSGRTLPHGRSTAARSGLPPRTGKRDDFFAYLADRAETPPASGPPRRKRTDPTKISGASPNDSLFKISSL